MGRFRISNPTQKLRGAAAILMVSSLGLFYPGTLSNVHAQSPTKATSAPPAGGPKEGIKVHGHWTIEIRNPDGKLVSHHEFENGLDGAESLGYFLRRAFKPGEWTVSVSSLINPADGPCRIEDGEPSFCSIFEPTSQQGDSSRPHGFKTLTISSQGGQTLLSGTATAAKNGLIEQVATFLSRCPVDAPGVCSANGSNFTRKDLATPIPVVAGQIIQVSVVISFS